MLLGMNKSWGQISIPNTTPVTQNFDAITNSATATLPTGFKLGTGSDYTAGTNTTATTLAAGTSGTGALTGTSGGGAYNYANGVTASSTDRAIGFLTSGSFTSPRTILLEIQNNGTSNISSLIISFDYEKYRTGTRAFDMTFFHGATSTSISTSATSGDQSYAADGANAVVNPPTTISKSITLTGLSIAPSGKYYFRWNYAGSGGSTNAQGLAIDNLTITGSFSASCTPPTTQATANIATSIATTSATLNWTRGNGNNALVIARPNASTNALPTNGTLYVPNTAYGNGATTGTNNFSVFTGTGTIVNITGLTANTLYTQQVYEYNNTGACYLTTLLTSVNFTSLHNAPTVGSGSGATSSSFTANWSAPSGGSASFNYEIQVNEDNTFTNANEFTQSSIVSSSTNVNVNTGLSPSTTYFYRVRAVNAGGNSAWSAVSAGIPTLASVSTTPTLITPTATAITSSTATLGANVTSDGGSTITARGTLWGTSPNSIGNVLSTTGTTGIFTQARTGFAPNTIYYYRGFATNANGTSYSPDGTFTTSAAATSIWNNPITGISITASPYTTGDVTNANVSVSGIRRGLSITGVSTNDRYNANGWSTGALDLNDYYEFTIVPNTGFKIDFTSFGYTGQVSSGTPSVVFRSSEDNFTSSIGAPVASGSTISLGAAQYQGIISPITFRIYVYSILAATTTYSINDFTFSGIVSISCTPPTIQATVPTSSSVTSNSANIGWTRGNGNNILTILRQGSAVTTASNNGVSYLDNAAFGSGASVGAGFVVYTGSGTNVNVTNLLSSTKYHYAMYEFSNSSVCYKLPPLVGTFTTSVCTAPTVAASSFVSTISGSSSLNIGWTRGNGDNVLVIARANSVVNSNPVSGINYTTNSTFGSGSQIGTGNFVVYKGTASSVSITGLNSNTTYYFSIYEYSNTDICYSTTELLGFETTQNAALKGTQFKPGDLVFVGYDTYIAGGGADKICVTNLIDIIPNTSFSVANACYERGALANQRTNKWNEANEDLTNKISSIKITYTGTGINKGSKICFDAPSTGNLFENFEINCTSSSNFITTPDGVDLPATNVNFSSSNSDQFWLMQGAWTSFTGYSLFTGNILGAITNGAAWVPISNAVSTSGPGSRVSRIHPQVDCIAQVGGISSSDRTFAKYDETELMSGTQRAILASINNPSNWTINTTTNNTTATTTDHQFQSAFCSKVFTVTGSSTDRGKWTGAINDNWFDCGNWETFSVPTSEIDVEIGTYTGFTNHALVRSTATGASLYNGLAVCKNLIVSGKELNLEGSANNKLHVYGNLIINSTGVLDMSDGITGTPDGQITIGGSWLNQLNETSFKEGESSVTFLSSQPQNIVNVTSDKESFYDLVISTSGTTFSLISNIVTENSLSVLGGNLDANNKSIDIKKDFINNGTFLGTGSRLTFDGTSSQSIGGSTVNTFNDIVIKNQSSSGVILATNQNLLGTLSLTGASSKFTTSGKIFTILSNQNTTGRIAQIPIGSALVGDITMQRNMPGNINSRILNYQLGSPVSSATVSQWQPTNTPPTAPSNGFYITGNFTGKNVPTNTGITSASLASLFTFNSSIGGFSQFPLAINTENLIPGVGYRAVVRDGIAAFGFSTISEKTLALTGAPTIGNFDFNLFYNTSNTLTSWNFIANPYPSEISADLTNATNYPVRTNVNPTAYVFNSVQGGYNTRNGAITILAGGGSWDGNVPSSQGFWVQTNNVNPALRVTESAKSTGSSALWRVETPLYYRINLKNHVGSDEVVVRQSDDATYSFDNDFDSRKLASPVSNGSPNLRIMSEENIGLIINTIPSDKKMPFDTLWLEYSSNSTLKHSFTCYGFENFDPNTNVYLLDIALGKITNMKNEGEYSFTNDFSAVSGSNKRFAILHEADQTTEVNLIKAQKHQISVFPNPFDGNKFTIESSETLQPSQIEVYNSFGVKIPFNIYENRNNIYQITINEDLKGILVLKINSSTSTIFKKLISK